MFKIPATAAATANGKQSELHVEFDLAVITKILVNMAN